MDKSNNGKWSPVRFCFPQLIADIFANVKFLIQETWQIAGPVQDAENHDSFSDGSIKHEEIFVTGDGRDANVGEQRVAGIVDHSDSGHS